MDLLNLKRLASYLQKFDMSFFDMLSVVDEFEKQIPAEFDFIREAEMMTTIRYNLQCARITDVVIPRIFPGLVSRCAITMSFIDGCRVDNQVALKLWGINPKQILKTIGRAYGQMLLVDGVAHCDRKYCRTSSQLSLALWVSFMPPPLNCPLLLYNQASDVLSSWCVSTLTFKSHSCTNVYPRFAKLAHLGNRKYLCSYDRGLLLLDNDASSSCNARTYV